MSIDQIPVAGHIWKILLHNITKSNRAAIHDFCLYKASKPDSIQCVDNSLPAQLNRKLFEIFGKLFFVSKVSIKPKAVASTGLLNALVFTSEKHDNAHRFASKCTDHSPRTTLIKRAVIHRPCQIIGSPTGRVGVPILERIQLDRICRAVCAKIGHLVHANPVVPRVQVHQDIKTIGNCATKLIQLSNLIHSTRRTACVPAPICSLGSICPFMFIKEQSRSGIIERFQQQIQTIIHQLTPTHGVLHCTECN